MTNSSDDYLSLKTILFCGAVTIFFLSLAGCAPVFSEMQSARLVGKDNVEITPVYSAIYFSDDDESDTIQEHKGIQLAYGLSNKTDIRLRFENISVNDFDVQANVIGLGPKFRLKDDNIAFFLPVGFAFGDNIDNSRTWQMHPTLLFTLPLNAYLEFNPSVKALVPLSNDSQTSFAFNFGAGISYDLSYWVVRPEYGFLFYPDSEGNYSHFSIGFSFYL
jgi:hypothetical protein